MDNEHCYVCGVLADLVSSNPDTAPTVCPEHCPEHEYVYERGTGHYCKHCGIDPPVGWYDEDHDLD